MYLSDPSPNFTTTHGASTMPGTVFEASNSFAAAAANLKKRKRDAVAQNQWQQEQ